MVIPIFLPKSTRGGGFGPGRDQFLSGEMVFVSSSRFLFFGTNSSRSVLLEMGPYNLCQIEFMRSVLVLLIGGRREP